MKARFNLATSPLENNRRFIAGASALGVIAAAALVLLSVHAIHTRRTNAKVRGEISRLEGRLRASQREQDRLRIILKNPKTVEVMDRAQFLNGLIEQRTFPWTKMFADLGEILPPGVRVMSISPQMDKTGRVKVILSISAANNEQATKFLHAMVSSAVFSNVLVTQESHSQGVSTDGAGAVMLALEAHYATI